MESERTDLRVTFNLNLSINPEKRGDRWALPVKELGVTFYSRTFGDAEATVKRGLDFLFKNVRRNGDEQLLRYLLARGVPGPDAIPEN